MAEPCLRELGLLRGSHVFCLYPHSRAPGLHAAPRQARHQALLQARIGARPPGAAPRHGAATPRHRRGEEAAGPGPGGGARHEDDARSTQAEAGRIGNAGGGGGGGDARRSGLSLLDLAELTLDRVLEELSLASLAAMAELACRLSKEEGRGS